MNHYLAQNRRLMSFYSMQEMSIYKQFVIIIIIDSMLMTTNVEEIRVISIYLSFSRRQKTTGKNLHTTVHFVTVLWHIYIEINRG